jgi:hypothetical protein
MKLKNDRDNYKTKFEQLEKESTQLKQENAAFKQEITKLKESYEAQKKKFQGHVHNMQRTIQQKATSQLQAYQEQSKKEIEELKKRNDELMKQNENNAKQIEEALEKEPEILRIKAQESMYKSKISRLETEIVDLKQRVQSSSENSVKAEVNNQSTDKTIAKDAVVVSEEFLPTSTSSSMPTTPNLPSTTPSAVVQLFDSNAANATTASPRSPSKVMQELPGDIQENISQPPPNVQQTSVQPASSSGDTSVSARQSVSNTGQMQNTPREKPPVKIQRHRGPLVIPNSPRVGPAQVASPTPAIEEQSLNQLPIVPDTEKVQLSEASETAAAVPPVQPVQPVQPIQQVQAETASLQTDIESQTSGIIEETPAESTVERKRSWDEIETPKEEPLGKSSLNVVNRKLVVIINELYFSLQQPQSCRLKILI